MRLLFFLLLCLPLPATAEDRQYGNVIFTIPEGWDTGGIRFGAQVLLSDLPDDECEYCYIYIAPGQKSGMSLTAYLAASRLTFVDKDDGMPEIEVMQQPEVSQLGPFRIGMMGQKIDSDFQMLFAIGLPDRIQLFAFEGPAYDEEGLTEAMGVLQRDMFTLLESVRFVSEGADPLMPPAVPGDLAGLYWGYSTGWTMQIDGTMQMDLDHRHLVFWPDGHFYDGTPPSGLTGIDPDALLATGDMEFGTYTVSGGKLRLAFASGEVEELDIDGEDFQDGDRTMYPVDPLADGERFEGSLSSMFFSGFTPGSGVTGGVSSASFTEFRMDGTWGGERSGGAFGNFDSGGGYALSNQDEYGGTYQVKDGILYRHSNKGGEPDTSLIFRVAGDIMIGEQNLETEDQ